MLWHRWVASGDPLSMDETVNPRGCKPTQGNRESEKRSPAVPGYGAKSNAAMNRRGLTLLTHPKYAFIYIKPLCYATTPLPFLYLTNAAV